MINVLIDRTLTFFWLFAIGCGCSSEEAPAAAAASPQKLVSVRATTFQPTTFRLDYTFPGLAQPIDSRRVASEASGRVKEAPFREGDTVKKGDLLLRVDASSNSAQIALLSSQADGAKRELARTKLLVKSGLATPQKLDQDESAYKQAALSLRQARVNRNLSTVKSPFGGRVTVKHLDVGEFATAGAALVDLVDLSTIKLVVTVPETAMRFIKEGEEVKVHFPSLESTAPGIVMRKGLVATKPTQTFPIDIQIPNPQELILPGMRAEVVVPKMTLNDALVLERDWLLEGVSRTEAVVVTKNEKGQDIASIRVVTLGESKGTKVVVTKGLDPGDTLVTQGHREVVDGTLLRVSTQPTSPAVPTAAAAPTILPVVAPVAQKKRATP